MVGLFDCLGLFALGLIGLVVFIALIVVYNDIANHSKNAVTVDFDEIKRLRAEVKRLRKEVARLNNAKEHGPSDAIAPGEP